MAHLALEDFYHESVQRYARDLYDFSCLRVEMDRLRDRPVKGGSVRVAKWIENFHYLCTLD